MKPAAEAKRLLPEAILDVLPLAIATVTPGGEVLPLNKSAQEFFGTKTSALPTPLVALAERVWQQGEAVTAYDVALLRNVQEHRATVHVSLLNEQTLLLVMDFKGTPHNPTASAWKQDITQAAGVMAAMMAHEVKNPLSSIRGAAQLLRDSIPESERPLADLIGKEALRISDLLDQFEIFSDERRAERTSLNIHEALQYSMRVAKAGFASHVTFVERYDPSLPEALSHRDLLVQLFLNIIKNASEALIGREDATITLSTAYQSGLRITNQKLPLTVTIADNGEGIPEPIRKKLFEPLVSSKAQGRGLGLAVVAKIASDIGAIVECDAPGTRQGASFTIHLPCGH